MRSKFEPLLLCFSCLLLVMGLTGCELTNSTSSTEKSNAVKTNTLSAKEQNALEEVFPKDKVIDVKITLDEADFQDMLENASDEEFKEASVNYNGVQFDHVGIRTKGNLSLRSVVNSDSDRYSFKISFDEYINQQFNGISKINLNNNFSDASYMREFLTYELAQSVGLPTPEFSYVNVYVNDELWGFYLAVEQIDEAYLDRNFETTTGALYKAEMTGTGSDLTWLGNDPDSYTGLVMKSEKSNDDILIDMLDELNNGSDYDKVLNVDNVLKYVALNVAASNMDSYLGSNKQNYYLYEDEGIFNILPWDYNMAFGGFGGSNLLIDEPTQGALAERPLIAKLLAVDEYKEQYHQILREMTNGYLKEDALTARVQELKELISSHVKKDPRPFYSYEEYEQSLPTLISFASTQMENITQQLNGIIPSSGDGSGMGPGVGNGGMGRGMNGEGADANTNNPEGAPVVPQMNGSAPVNGQGSSPSAPGNMPSGMPTDVSVDGAEQAPEDNNTDNVPKNNTDPNAVNNSDSDNIPNADQTQTDQTDTPSNGQQDARPNPFGAGRMNNGQQGWPMPEGGPGGGGFRSEGFGREGTEQQGSGREALYTGIALILLILSSLFITLYKRKRL